LEFDNDKFCFFTIINGKKSVEINKEGATPKSSEKSSDKILNLICANPKISAKDLAEELNISSRGG
jgi:predicted HTH transcriptional regulator